MRDAPDVRRRLRDLYDVCFGRDQFVVVCSPVKVIPEELERSIVYLELAVPDLAELVGFLGREAEAIRSAGGTVDTSEATLQQMARALQGLTSERVRATRSGARSPPATPRPAIPRSCSRRSVFLVNRTG